MAAPIIDNVTPSSVSLTPGQYADVTVTAHDPDSASGTVTITIADAGGAQKTAVVPTTVLDSITFGTATVAGVAVTVQRLTPSSSNPATYRIQA